MVVSDREHNLLAVNKNNKHNDDDELQIQFVLQGRTWYICVYKSELANTLVHRSGLASTSARDLQSKIESIA